MTRSAIPSRAASAVMTSRSGPSPTIASRIFASAAATARNRERLDTYTQALQRHGLEGVEREVRWLNELIDNENQTRRGGSADAPANQSGDTGAGPRRPRTRG